MDLLVKDEWEEIGFDEVVRQNCIDELREDFHGRITYPNNMLRDEVNRQMKEYKERHNRKEVQ